MSAWCGGLLLMVSTTALALPSSSEGYLAAQTIALEARGESFEGQVAVGEVIRNRAKQAHSDVEAVVKAPYQFSCWNNGKQARKALSGVSDGEMQRAWRAWEASATSNVTNGATHYFAPALCKPSWAKKLNRTARLGNHDFYA